MRLIFGVDSYAKYHRDNHIHAVSRAFSDSANRMRINIRINYSIIPPPQRSVTRTEHASKAGRPLIPGSGRPKGVSCVSHKLSVTAADPGSSASMDNSLGCGKPESALAQVQGNRISLRMGCIMSVERFQFVVSGGIINSRDWHSRIPPHYYYLPRKSESGRMFLALKHRISVAYRPETSFSMFCILMTKTPA